MKERKNEQKIPDHDVVSPMWVETSVGRINSQETRRFWRETKDARPVTGLLPSRCRFIFQRKKTKWCWILSSRRVSMVLCPLKRCLPFNATSLLNPRSVKSITSYCKQRERRTSIISEKKRQKRKRKGGHAIRQYQKKRKKKKNKTKNSAQVTGDQPILPQTRLV